MRVLTITGIFPPDIGGPATYVPQVAQGLVERGHEVTVVTLSDRLDHDDRAYPFQVVRLPRKAFKPRRMLKTSWTLVRLGRGYDVLFVNGLALEAVMANFVLRKPFVLKVVGDFAWERATNWGWISDGFETFQQKRYDLRVELLKALRTWWTRRAHRVIVPSRYLARWVARWGVPEERIVVVHNAIEPLEAVKPLPVPLSTPVKAVTVGRLIPLKRVDGILAAVAQVPGLGLIVVGDGPERPRLEQLAESLGITDRVYFAGRRNREETLGLMASCDLFVLNSSHETFSHVILEAMALGLPVVTTAVGGTPEVVKDRETGILIPVNGSSLCAVLRQLAEDERLRRRLGIAACADVRQRFSAHRMLEHTARVLQGVCRPAGREDACTSSAEGE